MVERSVIAEGRTFRLHLSQTAGSTVTVNLWIDDGDQPVSQLQGSLRLSDVRPASRVLASLLSGAASVLGKQTSATERIDRLREKYPNAYLPWTAEDDRRLRELHQQAVGIAELARTFGRQPSAIRSRLEKVLPPRP